MTGYGLSTIGCIFCLFVVLGPTLQAKKRRKEYAWRLTAYIAALDLIRFGYGFVYEVMFVNSYWEMKDGSVGCTLQGFLVHFTNFTENLYVCILAIIVYRLVASEGQAVKVKEKWWHSACVLTLGLTLALSALLHHGYHPATSYEEDWPYCWLVDPIGQLLYQYLWVYAELAFVFAVYISIFLKLRRWAQTFDRVSFVNKRLILADSFLLYPIVFFTIWIGPASYRIASAFWPCEVNCYVISAVFQLGNYAGVYNALVVAFRMGALTSFCACFCDKCRSIRTDSTAGKPLIQLTQRGPRSTDSFFGARSTANAV